MGLARSQSVMADETNPAADGAPNFPWVGSVEFTVDVAAAPWEAEEAFVHEIAGTIRGMVSDTQEATFGTIKLLKLSAVEAINQQFSLADICDAHSEFLLSAFYAVFDEDEEAKPELEIE